MLFYHRFYALVQPFPAHVLVVSFHLGKFPVCHDGGLRLEMIARNVQDGIARDLSVFFRRKGDIVFHPFVGSQAAPIVSRHPLKKRSVFKGQGRFAVKRSLVERLGGRVRR